MYALVATDIGATADDIFTYSIPDDMPLEVGTYVLVPLGTRKAVGFVVGFSETTDFENTKSISAIIDTPIRLTSELIEVAKWMAKTYICPVAKSISAMLPSLMQFKVESFIPVPTQVPYHKPLNELQSMLYKKIYRGEAAENIEKLYDICEKSKINAAIRVLEKNDLVKREYRIARPQVKLKTLKGVHFVSDEGRVLTSKQTSITEIMKSRSEDMLISELTNRYGCSSSAINTLIKNNVLQQVDLTVRRIPSFVRISNTVVELMPQQKKACDAIAEAAEAGSFSEHLLFGVTASGKTEVYLHAIEHTLKCGRTALVLLPEIALTTQIMNIFKSRFGDDVAVLHSALSYGERYDEWMRISEGSARVVLGARSAVFAPLSDIGIIIIDEEHESSYKQEDSQPRYNGRDVARMRAKYNNAVLLLGSATPSMESFYKAKSGRINLIQMPSRIENRAMPAVIVADLKDLYKTQKPSIFTPVLQDAMKYAMDNKHQIMLLQNRRAFSTMLLCRDCGYVAKCPNCAVTLKYHHSTRLLTCHYCSHTEPAGDVCPKCHGTKLNKFGIGTEKVQLEAERLFPNAKVLRLDRDTTSKKGAHNQILSAFKNGEADILVGTQMIAKGLDFPNVTLVGIISADTSLNLPDFRAAERTFQLIAQVAGRAGRGKSEGRVIVQTFDPDNMAIKYAANHDYISFYNSEISDIKELSYPPFSSFATLLSSDEDEKKALGAAKDFVETIKSLPCEFTNDVRIIGPIAPAITKIKQKYRYRIILKSKHRQKLIDLLHKSFETNHTAKKLLAVDVDPITMI